MELVMHLRFLPRYLLLLVWGGLALFFLSGALFVFFNYFFVWRPDKISMTLRGTLVIAGYQLLFGILGSALFVGLVRRRKWLFCAYWTSLFLVMMWLLTAISPSVKDIPSIIGCGGVLAIIGIIIQRKREWFGFQSTT